MQNKQDERALGAVPKNSSRAKRKARIGVPWRVECLIFFAFDPLCPSSARFCSAFPAPWLPEPWPPDHGQQPAKVLPDRLDSGNGTID